MPTMTDNPGAPAIDAPQVDLAVLSEDAQLLWSREPEVMAHERSELLAELIDITLTVDQLALRSEKMPLDDDEQLSASVCATRLGVLAGFWKIVR